MTTNTESLRTFAEQHGELQFAHLCTAALAGEEWAVERIGEAIQKLEDMQSANGLNVGGTAYMLDIIRATDTTRPSGAIARSVEV